MQNNPENILKYEKYIYYFVSISLYTHLFWLVKNMIFPKYKCEFIMKYESAEDKTSRSYASNCIKSKSGTGGSLCEENNLTLIWASVRIVVELGILRTHNFA